MAKSSNPTKNEISYADVRFRIYPLSIHCKNAIPKGSSYSLEIEKGRRILKQFPHILEEKEKGFQLTLNNIDQKITFTIATQKSTVIQWNLYNGTNNQVLVDSGKIDVKSSFEDGFKAAKQQKKKVKDPDFCQQKQCILTKTGLVIKFLLLISENDQKLNQRQNRLVSEKKLISNQKPKAKIEKMEQIRSEIKQPQSQILSSSIMQIKAPEAAISLKSEQKIKNPAKIIQSKLPKISQQEEIKKQQTVKGTTQDQVKWPGQQLKMSEISKGQFEANSQIKQETSLMSTKAGANSQITNNQSSAEIPKEAVKKGAKTNTKAPAKVNKIGIALMAIFLIFAAIASYKFDLLQMLPKMNKKSGSKTRKAK